MKKILLLLLLAPVLVSAQPDEERIESLRIAFLTQYLSLTPQESQQFWPVYNQMRDEIKPLMQAKRKRIEQPAWEKMTDDQLRDYIETSIATEQQLLQIRQKYISEFSKVLSLRKVAMLTDAEEVFKRELLQHARDRKPGGGKPGGPPPPQAE